MNEGIKSPPRQLSLNDSEMATRVQAFDWASTPLGPIEQWPPGLRTAASLCLNSRFPMMVWWGSDLTYIYNDAYAPMLGQRHPAALGRPGAEVWADVWPIIGPQVEAVMQQGKSTWNERVRLVMERNGYPEETWFTWSYSAISDDQGNIGGLLNTCREDTTQVLAEARHAFLAELGDTLHHLSEFRAMKTASAERLGFHLGVDGVSYLAIDEGTAEFVMEAQWTADGATPLAGRHPLSVVSEAIRALLRRGITVRLADLLGDSAGGKTTEKGALGNVRLFTALIVPHFNEDRLTGVLYLRCHRERYWSNEVVQLAGQVAERTWEAAARAEAQKALKVSEERFRTLFDSIDEGFCVIEMIFDAALKPVDYRFLEINPAFAKHSGLKDAEGRSILEMGITLEPEWFETYGRVALTGEPVRWVNRAQDLGGRWFGLYAFRVGAPENHRVAILFTDMTVQKGAEEVLRDSEERLSEIFRQAPSFICVLRGPDHIVERANDRYYQLVGHRDILGKSIRDALPEVAGQGYFERLDDVYRTGTSWIGSDVPVSLQRTPGATPERRYLDLVYMALRGSDGNINGILAQGVDLTERKQAESAVRESEERLRLIMANVKDHAIFTLDLDGRVTAWNVGATLVFGYDEHEILDQSAAILFTPEDRAANRPQIEMRLAAVEDVADDTRCHIRKDGRRFFASGSLEGLRDEAGQLRGFVKVVRDITQERKMDEQREQLLGVERTAREEAERIGRMKDEFLATLSHELRTPLSAILGWAQILARPEDRDEETVAQGIEVIERNARAQSKLIEELLDMSRIISGKVRLDIGAVNLADIINAALAAVRPSADAKGIRLQSTFDPSVDVVKADPNRLQQVLWNLLSNAVKFTSRGGRAQVALTRVESHIEISVADTGQGIKREFLPHVFERFRQADASTTRTHGGLGLGLAIVKNLVELHGGVVRASSPGEGHGSTFVVSLPLTPQFSAGAEESPSFLSTQTPSGDAVKRISLNGIRVLIVDDEPDARSLIRRFLEVSHAEVTVADSMATALEAIAREVPDILVSDIGLPDQDGYDLIRELRLLPADRGGSIPAIALTAFARTEDRQRALVGGYQMHISKPVDVAELIAAIKSLVDLAQRRRS